MNANVLIIASILVGTTVGIFTNIISGWIKPSTTTGKRLTIAIFVGLVVFSIVIAITQNNTVVSTRESTAEPSAMPVTSVHTSEPTNAPTALPATAEVASSNIVQTPIITAGSSESSIQDLLLVPSDNKLTSCGGEISVSIEEVRVFHTYKENTWKIRFHINDDREYTTIDTRSTYVEFYNKEVFVKKSVTIHTLSGNIKSDDSKNLSFSLPTEEVSFLRLQLYSEEDEGTFLGIRNRSKVTYPLITILFDQNHTSFPYTSAKTIISKC